MPNHVYSKMVITGPEAHIAKFLSAIKKGDQIDISHLYPNPLAEYQSPAKIVSQEEFDAAKAKQEEIRGENPDASFSIGLPITQAMYDEFMTKYGADNWYDWALKHWGTKWGIYEASILDDVLDKVILEYQTAWSPATGLWQKVSKQFPELKLESKFVDEGGDYCGEESYQNGAIIFSADYEVVSEAGKAVCEDVGYTLGCEEDEKDETSASV